MFTDDGHKKCEDANAVLERCAVLEVAKLHGARRLTVYDGLAHSS